MGVVWRAHDSTTNRVVAVKVLPTHLAQDESFQRRFRREAHAAARLNDPHVIPIHGYGEIDGQLYVDMRLINGDDLAHVLSDGALSPARAVVSVEQIARALDSAHKVGLVHRDVKPSNILVADYDFAYLIDFGIARGAGQTRLTDTGGMVGTWHYIAPERLSGDDVDARSDIYALACVLYECLTGRRPFPGDTMESQVAGHLTAPPPKPSVVPGVPDGFDAVVAKGMAKNPGERYASTLELAHAARSALAASVPPAPPTRTGTLSLPAADGQSRVGRGVKIGVALALAAVVVAVVAVVAFSSLGGSDDAPSTSDQRETSSPPTAPSLTGTWSGPVSGDQTGFDVTADITDGPTLTATVTYPQLDCRGTWTQIDGSTKDLLLVTEKITGGTCVASEVTLRPFPNGTLHFSSSFFSASQQRTLTINATMTRSA